MGTYVAGGFNIRGFLRPYALRVFIHIFHFFDRHPWALRIVHGFLRLKPVWQWGHTVLVTGDRQVHDALRRDDDFPLPELRASKFLTGPFVLGMTRTPQFELERAELEAVILRGDAAIVRALAVAESQNAIARLAGRGHLDVVTELSIPVGKTLITQYFGVNEYHGGRQPELIDDLRRLGAMVASPDALLPRFQSMAALAADRVSSHVHRRIRVIERYLRLLQLFTPNLQPVTVLGRLVHRRLYGHSGLSRDAVRRNIIGVLLPGTALVNRAFATSLVQLLKREALRDTAIAAARATPVRYAEIEACLLEALRFHPVFPVMPRHCPHATVLPVFRGEYPIPPGRDVFVSVAAAMFDPRGQLFNGPAGGYPSEARLRNASHYRHFGGGIHACLGPHIALAQMSAMLAELLKLSNVRVHGSIQYGDDGISPQTLDVTFTPAPAVAPVPAAVPGPAAPPPAARSRRRSTTGTV